MGGATFTRSKTFIAGEVLYATDVNGIETNILNNFNFAGLDDYSETLTQMRTVTDPYPSGTPSLATSGAGEVERLRYQINQMKGGTYWYEDAPTSLTALNSASGLVKVSSNDTTSGYLNGKLVAGDNITLTEGSDAGNETLTIASSNSNTSVPVRQTVLGAPVDSSGLPNFLPATATGLNLTSENITSTTPLVATAANGFGLYGAVNRIGQATDNITWSSLTDASTNYLYVDIAADGTLTTGATTLAPIYQQGGTYSTTDKQYTFNIVEMVGKVGNGTTATQTYRVFVGEAVTSGGNVTSTVEYALMGRYVSAWTNTLPVYNTVTSQNHNIGVKPLVYGLRAKCLSVEHNYSIGDYAELYIYGGEWVVTPVTVTSHKAFQFITGSRSASMGVMDKNSAGTAPYDLTITNWSYSMYAERGW